MKKYQIIAKVYIELIILKTSRLHLLAQTSLIVKKLINRSRTIIIMSGQM